MARGNAKQPSTGAPGAAAAKVVRCAATFPSGLYQTPTRRHALRKNNRMSPGRERTSSMRC